MACLQQDGIYTTGEAAYIFQVSSTTIAKWTRSGVLSCYRLQKTGSMRRITRQAILNLVAQHEGEQENFLERIEKIEQRRQRSEWKRSRGAKADRMTERIATFLEEQAARIESDWPPARNLARMHGFRDAARMVREQFLIRNHDH